VVDELQARSISRPVWDRLKGGGLTGRIAAKYEHTVLLQDESGDLVALVTPEIGDGPLNTVLDTPDLGGLGDLRGLLLRPISLERATVWEPQPDWPGLRAARGAIAPRLACVRDIALECAPKCGLLALLGSDLRGLGNLGGLVATASRKGIDCLRAGWEGADAAQLRAGAEILAGLGPGLTPAGDDFLCGAMLWAWLAHCEPGPLCRLLAEAAAPRTTALAAALLRRAALGECSAPWHVLLAALRAGDGDALRPAVEGVLAQGHTSGADALAGFLSELHRLW